jgi:glyoxylase-like metal-dependent hydrolase (beta-lactamase superfamily II)
MAELLVETLTNGPFMENCFIAADAATRRGILIDPGDEERRILETVKALDLEITEIVATHGHIDHAGAVAPLKRVLGVPFAIHPAERPWLEKLPHQAMMFGLSEKETPAVDRELAHGDVVRIGELEAQVLHTPGHSAGGICLLLQPQKTVFVGDTLFAGSIGRTDLPGGSFETLIEAIRVHLLGLPDDTTVYSGHGPATTVGAERRGNPFLQPGASLIF